MSVTKVLVELAQLILVEKRPKNLNWVLGTDFWTLSSWGLWVLSRFFFTLNFTPYIYQFRACHPHHSYVKEVSEKVSYLFGCRFCFVWKLCFRQCLVMTKGIYDVTAKITRAHMLSIYYSCSKSCSGNLIMFRKWIQQSGIVLKLLTLPLV